MPGKTSSGHAIKDPNLQGTQRARGVEGDTPTHYLLSVPPSVALGASAPLVVCGGPGAAAGAATAVGAAAVTAVGAAAVTAAGAALPRWPLLSCTSGLCSAD